VAAEKGNSNAVTDAGVAALLADAACRGAVYNVRVNVQALDDKSKGAGLERDAGELVTQASDLAKKTTALVERALGG
jgi:glutamate formiminotransferase/formiminotetrahydrofolate cyclodeaminase